MRQRPRHAADLLHIEYGSKRLFPLLALLFPFVDLRNDFHIDHVFPISCFSRARLVRAGFSEEEAKTLGRHANQLPNLQLLDGAIANEKRAALPAERLVRQYPDAASAQHYCEKHLLGELPADLAGFDAFLLGSAGSLADSPDRDAGGTGARDGSGVGLSAGFRDLANGSHRRRNVYGGGKRRFDRSEVTRLAAAGLSAASDAAQGGCSRMRVYRILREI